MSSGEVLRGYFDRISASNGLGSRIRDAGVQLSMVISDEDLTLNLDASAESPVTSSREPTQPLVLVSDGTSWCDILSGDLNIWVAIGDGRVAVKGPVEPIATVWPAISFAGPLQVRM